MVAGSRRTGNGNCADVKWSSEMASMPMSRSGECDSLRSDAAVEAEALFLTD